MFTLPHYIWLAICFILILMSLFFIRKYKPSFSFILTICCIICVFSELFKIYSSIKLVPSSDGTTLYPYLQLQHLPFHLCSIQILFIFYLKFSKESSFKYKILAYLYPTSIIGALFALAMPSIFTTSISITEAFTSLLSYQFFIYHSMLVVLGICIPLYFKETIQAKHYFSTMGILAFLFFISFYLNSLFAAPIYEGNTLLSVEYVTNFFFSYKAPLNIQFSEIWQWHLYILILVILAFALIALFYIPFFKQYFHSSKKIK